MVTVAVTGHVKLNAEDAAWIFDAFVHRLHRLSGAGLHGITCLAMGTDQIFARAILSLSGTFEVVLPAQDYRSSMAGTASAREFEELVQAADHVRTMPFAESGRQAYLAASEDMLQRCDLLLAAWDGRPSRRAGDTADVIESARRMNVDYEVLWPAPVTPAEAQGHDSSGATT